MELNEEEKGKTEIDNRYVYYDKDLKDLDIAFQNTFNIFKKIKERNEMSDILCISKSIFDRRCLESYRRNHPDKLFYLKIDDITMSVNKHGKEYYISLVGCSYIPQGFISECGDDTTVLRSADSVTDYAELALLFISSLRNLLLERFEPGALF